MRRIAAMALLAMFGQQVSAKEYHVSTQGTDKNSGSASDPLKTISAAAQVAQPGDTVIVHEGTYRERINPPRGGWSDSERIVYRAAKGEAVTIKGSEIAKGWVYQENGVWKLTLPNTFFGDYNPYKDIIAGDWFHRKDRDHHTGEVYLNGEALYEVATRDEISGIYGGRPRSWYCESDDNTTTIWGAFGEYNPNQELIEINVRPACFYPDQPGRDYITVSGFTMRHAATQWAAPTAEQIGLIGTHWSKGWIIENNTITDSKCVGVTLGKDRASGHNGLENAEGYNVVIDRVLERGDWTKETIGSHIVRNNTISNCGEAGICGSLGAIYSEISGNHIYAIHRNKPFFGFEVAAIKFHAPIDCLIAGNRIHNSFRGIWLDWMTQGTRVTRNLLYNNDRDFFAEVNHGPYLVDNNVFLSKVSIDTWSHGGAYVHNLVGGLNQREKVGRATPYHTAHSTQVDGIKSIEGGDERIYNNIFSRHPKARKDDTIFTAELPMFVDGNVYLNGSLPFSGEKNFLEQQTNPMFKCIEKGDNVYLHMTLPPVKGKIDTRRVTTKSLGKPLVPALPYENADGSPLKVDTDYFGKKRNKKNPTPGPFANPGEGEVVLKLW